jgi:molybdopterin synthase sulfur carrier subunit
MPNYKILLFGICRDLLNNETVEHQNDGLLTSGQLLQSLKKSYPALENLPSLRIAVDHHFPKPEFLVEETMEIALIPPVSGG